MAEEDKKINSIVSEDEAKTEGYTIIKGDPTLAEDILKAREEKKIKEEKEKELLKNAKDKPKYLSKDFKHTLDRSTWKEGEKISLPAGVDLAFTEIEKDRMRELPYEEQLKLIKERRAARSASDATKAAKIREDILGKNYWAFDKLKPPVMWADSRADMSTLIPIGDNYNPDSEIYQDYHYFPRSKKHPYTIIAKSPNQAKAAAQTIYNELEKSGADYWSGAYKELQSLTRQLLETRGDPAQFRKVMRQERNKDMNEVHNWLNNKEATKEMPEDAKEMIAGLWAWGEWGGTSIPNYIFSLTPDTASGLDVILGIVPPLDGKLLEITAASANYLEEAERKGGIWTDVVERFHVPFMGVITTIQEDLGDEYPDHMSFIDESLNHNPDKIARTIGRNWPYVGVSAEDIERQMANSKNASFLTGAVRLFARDFAFGLSALSPLALPAAKYSAKLALKAEQKLLASGMPVTKKTVYNKMESLIRGDYEKARADNQGRVLTWLDKEIKLGAGEWGYTPWTFVKKYAGTEAGISVGIEAADRWVYPYTKELLKETWFEDDPHSVLNVGVHFATSIASVLAGKAALTLGDKVIHEHALPAVNTINTTIKAFLPGTASNQGIKKFFELINLPSTRLDQVIKQMSPIYAKNLPANERKILRNMLKQFHDLNQNFPDEAEKLRQSTNMMLELFKEAEQVGWGDKINKNFVTLGTFTGLNGLRQAEISMLEMIAGKDIKIDSKFKFIKKAIEIGKAREQQEIDVGKLLVSLGEDIKGKETPTLNAYKDLLQEEMIKTREKSEELASITEDAVKLQVAEIMLNARFDTNTQTELLKILQEYPSLKINDETAKSLKNVYDATALLKMDGAISKKAFNQFEDKLMELNPVFTEANVKNYGKGDNWEIVKENVAASGEIKDYSSVVALTNMARAEDYQDIWSSHLYTKAFDRIGRVVDKEDVTIDITDFLIKINKETRDQGNLMGDKSFLAEIKPYIETHAKKQLENHFNTIAASLKNDGNKKANAAYVKEMYKKNMLEEEKYIGRKGELTTLDYIEETIEQGYKFDFSFEHVFNMRKFANAAKRDASQAKEKTKANTLKLFATDLNKLLNTKIDLYKTKSMDMNLSSEDRKKYGDAAKLFIEAEENIKITHDRLRQSLISTTMLKYTQRVDDLGEYTKENAIKQITFVNEKTGLPVNKTLSLSNWASGRVISPDQNLFLDEVFEKYSKAQLLQELKVRYGEPIKDEVTGEFIVDSAGQYTYRLPTDGDPLYKSYKNFLKVLNVYTTSRFLKETKTLEAKGVWNWGKIVNNTDSLKAFVDNLKFGQLPPSLTNSGKGTHLDFAEKIEYLDRHVQANQSKDRLLGNEIWEDLLKRGNMENEANGVVLKSMRKIQKNIQEGAPEAKRLAKRIEMLANIVKLEGDKINRATNPESFVQIMMDEMRFAGSPVSGLQGAIKEQTSPLLDKVIETAIKKGMSEEEAKKSIGSLIAVGLTDMATRTTNNYKWKDQGNQRISNLKRNLMETTDITNEQKVKYQKKFKEEIEDVAGGNYVEKEAEKFVDGRVLYDLFERNEAFIKKYLVGDQRYQKLKLLMKLTTVGATEAQLKMLDPSAGLPKMQLATVLSRAAAVYSQRASIRYPLAELSYSLAKHKEAEAVAALLAADGEFLDLVTDVVVTGNFEQMMSGKNFKLVEAFFADLHEGTVTPVLRGFIESNATMSDEDKFFDAMYNLHPELHPENVFPIREPSYSVSRENLRGFATGQRSKDLVNFDKQESYTRYLGKKFNEMMRNNKTYGATIKAIRNDLDTIPLDVLLDRKPKGAWITIK